MLRLDIMPCVPPFWARDGHSQTILGHLLPSPRLLRTGVHECLVLPDGDQLVTTFYAGASDVVVFIFHGLSGDTASDYMERTAQVCLDLGHSVYLVNHRGCGEGESLARGNYHSGRGDDLSQVIAHGRKRHPGRRLLAVGFSLSGNALLCLLTGLRGEVTPDYAIAVNAPIDLDTCARNLERGINRLYDTRFVRALQQSVRRRHQLGLISRKYVFGRFASVRDFDEIFTAPEGGFQSRDEYYRLCSTHQHLHKIAVPTVILTAADDPIVPVKAYRDAKLSSSVHLHVEPVGGHMGYLSGRRTPLGSYRWMDYALREAVLGLLHQPPLPR